MIILYTKLHKMQIENTQNCAKMKTQCTHKGTCSTCPYDYCIDETKEPTEKADRSEYFQKYYSKKRDDVNKAHREAYRQKKKNGICVRCDQKATHGIYCRDHYIKQKKRFHERAQAKKIQRHERGLVPELRTNKGQCLWCGEKATGGTKACDRHRKIFAEASKKSEGREYFSRLNKELFKRKGEK